jgi:hypothetical protein
MMERRGPSVDGANDGLFLPFTSPLVAFHELGHGSFGLE